MTAARTARLAPVELPELAIPEVAPELPSSIYPDRVERLRERAARRGYDQLVVYADREHSANLSYLTGFDPRFEEAILIVGMTGTPTLLAGNECIGLARDAHLSNLAAFLPPFLVSPDLAMTLVD